MSRASLVAAALLLLAFAAGAYAAGAAASAPAASAAAPVQTTGLIVGRTAPEFALRDLAGMEVRLSDLRGKPAVLFFNEGAMCYPACWQQTAAFASDPRFSGIAFSIVVDPPSEWQRISARIPELASARMLFDTDGRVSKSYGMLTQPSSMHPGATPGHTYVLIDSSGRVTEVIDDPAMGIWNDQLAAKLRLEPPAAGATSAAPPAAER